MPIIKPTSGKELSLAVLTIVTGLANAYLWKGALFARRFENATFYSLPVIALFAFAILFALSVTFIRERALRIATAVLSSVSGFILIPYQSVILPGAALAAVGGWYAGEQIANEYAASNYFSVQKILRGGLPVFFTAVALILAVFYFSFIGGQSDPSLLPKGLFNAIVPLLEQPLQGILPGFRSDATTDQLIMALASQQLGGGVDVSQLPPTERRQLLSEGREALSEQLGIELTGGEKGTDVLYRAANAQIAKFVGPYRSYLPFIAAFGFFVAIKAFTLPVYWISLLLVSAVVKLLVATGFLKRYSEMVQITRIGL